MPADRLAILIVGVGGQGVLTAGRMLGDAAHAAGLPVVEGQLHGMSQRGGSVECSVLIGPGASSYVRVADVVVGLEPIETARALPRVGPRATVLFNSGRVVPAELSLSGRPYPSLESILALLREAGTDPVVVDGPSLLGDTGDRRSLNVVMLGALAGLDVLPVDAATLRRAVTGRGRPEIRAANGAAFDVGHRAVAGRRSSPRPSAVRGARTGQEAEA